MHRIREVVMPQARNFLRFTNEAGLEGEIHHNGTLYHILGEPAGPYNFHMFGYSPRGRKVAIGGIGKRFDANGNEYLHLRVSLPGGPFEANFTEDPRTVAFLPLSSQNIATSSDTATAV